MSFYRINAGPAAADQGAIAPLSTLFSLAEVLETKVLSGEYYGDDYLVVPKDSTEKAIAEELLTNSKLIWELVPELPHHLRWMV